jgi:hypothetical protein
LFFLPHLQIGEGLAETLTPQDKNAPLPFFPGGGYVLTARPTLAGFGDTPQLRRLALSVASIRRKRHENVMSIVMSNSLKL